MRTRRCPLMRLLDIDETRYTARLKIELRDSGIIPKAHESSSSVAGGSRCVRVFCRYDLVPAEIKAMDLLTRARIHKHRIVRKITRYEQQFAPARRHGCNARRISDTLLVSCAGSLFFGYRCLAAT